MKPQEPSRKRSREDLDKRPTRRNISRNGRTQLELVLDVILETFEAYRDECEAQNISIPELSDLQQAIVAHFEGYIELEYEHKTLMSHMKDIKTQT